MAHLPLFLLASLLPHIGYCAYVDMGIVNGSVVTSHSRPYMVSVQNNRQHACGGFLVSEKFVMTAAHCWKAGVKLTVVVGSLDLKKSKQAQKHIEVKLYHIHPNYDSDTLLNDIMLLQLNTTIKKNKNINWIPIPKKKNHDVKAKQVCSIAGWGKQSEKGEVSRQLMEVNVTVINTKVCKKAWNTLFPDSSWLCTRGHGGFCQGDSGGPLVCKNTAVGIVSFYASGDCKLTTLPYVYTKISHFLSWINGILGNKE